MPWNDNRRGWEKRGKDCLESRVCHVGSILIILSNPFFIFLYLLNLDKKKKERITTTIYKSFLGGFREEKWFMEAPFGVTLTMFIQYSGCITSDMRKQSSYRQTSSLTMTSISISLDNAI